MADWIASWIDWFNALSTTWPLWGKLLAAFGVAAAIAGGIGALISFWQWTFGGALKRRREKKAKLAADADQARRDEDARQTLATVERTRAEGVQTNAQIAALTGLVTQMKAQLDRQAAAANPNSAPDPAERARRDAAVAGIAADPTPAAQSAIRAIITGDLPAAVATLERDARADVANAAEKYRRLGALVREIDVRKAREAYEAAFALQPADFSTCIELSRLRAKAGDTPGARAAAEAATRVAGTDRERSVALNDLGDVLAAQGDGPGGLASYRDSLAIADRLAKSDPGNAAPSWQEWQRDLSVSHDKISLFRSVRRHIALRTSFLSGRAKSLTRPTVAPNGGRGHDEHHPPHSPHRLFQDQQQQEADEEQRRDPGAVGRLVRLDQQFLGDQIEQRD